MPNFGDARTGSEREQRLYALLEPVTRSEGLVLVELTLRHEQGGRVLRLCVDRPEGGITLDECALLSRQVSDLLDVEDPVEGAYRLEVTSPGLTRPLKTCRDFEVFAGRPARLTVRDAEGASRTVSGTLKGLAGEEVLLEVEGRLLSVPLGQVAKARLELVPSKA